MKTLMKSKLIIFALLFLTCTADLPAVQRGAIR